MAWQLTVEVRDHAPRISLGERAVLLAIAEQARVETRRTPPLGRDELAKFAGLQPSGLRAALRRLRDRGLEVRVPLDNRTSSDGRPMFAVPGVRTTYELPEFDSGLSALLSAPDAGAPFRGGEPDAAADGQHSPADDANVDDDTTAPDDDVDNGGADHAAQPVDNSVTSDDKGGTGCPPAIHKGGTGCPDRGARDDSQRGARNDPPSRTGVPVGGRAHVREAGPSRAVDAGTPAPAIDAALDALGVDPPRCPEHGDLAADIRVPSCPDCAGLRRAHKSRRSEIVRDEARRRRRCRSCDELGWLIGDDGRTLAAPARRCTHGTAAAPTSKKLSKETVR